MNLLNSLNETDFLRTGKKWDLDHHNNFSMGESDHK